MRRLGLDDKQLKPRTVLGRISWAKNHMLDPQEMYLQSADPITEKIAHIFENYRKELRKANALDFDDLLLESRAAAQVVAAGARGYQRRFEYLLMDEYQDTNRPQYELMKLLAGTQHNVCVVGDEDQSIYSWRGADIRNILEFEKRFSRGAHHPAGTELPLDAGDPGSGVGGGGQQREAQRQDSLDGAPGRQQDWLLRGARWRERIALCRRLHLAAT